MSFHGSVLVTRERGKFVNKIKEVFRAGKTVKIPDPDFEAIYEVYASNEEATRQLFTPSLIKLLKQLPEIVDAQVQLAFNNGKILIAAKDSKPFLNRFSIKMDTIHYRHFFADVVRECTLAINLIDEFDKVEQEQRPLRGHDSG